MLTRQVEPAQLRASYARLLWLIVATVVSFTGVSVFDRIENERAQRLRDSERNALGVLSVTGNAAMGDSTADSHVVNGSGTLNTIAVYPGEGDVYFEGRTTVANTLVVTGDIVITGKVIHKPAKRPRNKP